MCMRDDKAQAKLRVTLNLIHTLSKALSVSATLESDLADAAAFNCSELILRAAIELHNHVSAVLNSKEDAPLFQKNRQIHWIRGLRTMAMY